MCTHDAVHVLIHAALGDYILDTTAHDIVKAGGIADSSGEAGAPDEIEITPEMIEAGLEAYYAADTRVCDTEYVVGSILRAALKNR